MFTFIAHLFNTILYYPLFNALVVIYNTLPGNDFGIAILVLTLIIRLILYPASVKAFHSQKALQDLQPKIQEIQRQYKDDKEAQARETLALYQKEKINPFSGIFLTLIQLPILIALYNVFWKGFSPTELSHLYSFVANPTHMNPFFLQMIDLSKPNLWLAGIAGVVQFFQTKMLIPQSPKTNTKSNDMAVMIQKQMAYMFPVVTVIILFRLPSALGLYWIASSALSILQQYIVFRKTKNPSPDIHG